MARRRLSHKEVKKLVLKVVSDCKALAKSHVKNWKPVDKKWPTINGAVYLRLSDDTQVAVERGSLEQQIHIAIAESQYRSEQERINYRITEFYIEPGITGTHDNRPEFIRLQHNIGLQKHRFIIFKEISRLVRDVEIWKRFFKLCQTYDCEICIRGLPFNPNDPASILQLDQLAAYAEFESRTTSKRIKESNHSALITSGKFNGNFPLLGFDVVNNEHGESTGVYRPNKKELKQVEWIMKSFLRADQYKTLIQWCDDKNIKNKRGQKFNHASIKALLSNPRYIGKWYRNKHNEGKRQNKLMPYDRYTEVSFDYGCVIEESLWSKVQEKIKEMESARVRGVRRCYPLSGLLVFDDGSTFVGHSAKGRSSGLTYYYNKQNNLRIRSELFETEVEKILRQIVCNSDEFQQSISNFMSERDNAVDVMSAKIQEIDDRLQALDDEKAQLDKRLNFLLDDDDPDMAQSFKEEYKKQYLLGKKERQELLEKREKFCLLQDQVARAEAFGKAGDMKVVNAALGHLRRNDLISLKSLYKKLFPKILVRFQDNSKIQLKFFFNNVSSTLGRVEDIFRAWIKMVESSGSHLSI